MSAPVSTPSAAIDFYPLFGDPSWIPARPVGAIDAAGLWLYYADSRSSGAESARVIRFNLSTHDFESWLPGGTLPVAVTAWCFKADFSGFLFTAIDDNLTHLRLLDFATQTVSDLGDIGGFFIDRIVNIPGTTDYIGSNINQKSLVLLSLDSSDVLTPTLGYLISAGWTCPPDVMPDGSLLRGVQNGGGGTNGPLVKHPAGRGNFTQIIAGRFDDGADANGSDPYHANFSLDSVKANDDGSVIYFTTNDVLKKLNAGAITTITGGGNPRHIVGYSPATNQLVTQEGLSFVIWS